MPLAPYTYTENRKRFFDRLENVLATDDRLRIELAYIVAKELHRSHERKGEVDVYGNPVRYFEHPRRVALILMDDLKCYDVPMIQSALLHDVVEDCDGVTNTHIRVWFPDSEVATLVQCLTHCEDNDLYPQHLADKGDWRPILLKFCDSLDNSRTLESCAPNKRAKIAKKIEENYLPVFFQLHDLLPARYNATFVRLYREIGSNIAPYSPSDPL